MLYSILVAGLVLVFCIMTGLMLSMKLPKRTTAQLELECNAVLNVSDCSMEKVVENLQAANKLVDIQKEVQLRLD